MKDENFDQLCSDSSFIYDMQNVAYDSIKSNYKKDVAPIFIAQGTNFKYCVEKSSYKIVLNNCLKQFELDENWTKCSECRDLIESL
jgi:hypothetical protein